MSEADTPQWTSIGRFWRGAWRSSAAWVCVATLFVHGVVLPVAALFGIPSRQLDWPMFIAVMAGLGVLTHYRSRDLKEGVTT